MAIPTGAAPYQYPYWDESTSGQSAAFSYTTHSGPVYLDSQDAQTAVGTNRATAFALAHQLTVFSSVPSSTGALLPPSQPGLFMVVVNNDGSSGSLTMYAAGSDTINGTAGSGGVALAAGHTAIYFSASTGTWFELVSAF